MAEAPTTTKKPIIMVSSTVYGIEELLEQVFGILNSSGFSVWMSYKGTVPLDPTKSNFENCLAAVDGCDLFLGILTTNYGSGKDGTNLSITHQEILRAIKLQKPSWFLAHHDLVLARGLLRDLGYRTAAERSQLNLAGKKLIDDLRVIDLYEAVIKAEMKLADRKGNWAQPFATTPEATIFVVSQFLRFAEAAEFVKEQPLAALGEAAKGKRGQKK